MTLATYDIAVSAGSVTLHVRQQIGVLRARAYRETLSLTLSSESNEAPAKTVKVTLST